MESRKLRKRYLFLIISGFVVIIIIVLLCSFMFNDKIKVKEFDEKITINYGDEFTANPGEVCYGNMFDCKKLSSTISGEVDTNKLGAYEITYTYTHGKYKKELKQIVNVSDIESPILEVEGNNIKSCPNGNTENLIIKATDNYDGDLTDKVIKKIEDNKLIIEVSDSSGNTSRKELDTEVIDDEGPIIKLNGSSTRYVIIGSKYDDEGAIASDNCDDNISIQTENNVDTSKIGTYYVTYKAIDSAGNETTEKRTVIVHDDKPVDKNPTGDKIVYLTFDDGPSAYTSKLLDILKKYNVKATFFVTGFGSDDMILREYQEGHTVALHTNTHDYKSVYASVDSYFNDLYAIRSRVERITGHKSNLIRFPGGSSNAVSNVCMSVLAREVENKGFHYFDWNVSSGDAGSTTSTDQVFKNVVGTLKSSYSIVLQHDSKSYSVDAVEKIIKFGIENGYTFKPLTENSPGAHHGKRC